MKHEELSEKIIKAFYKVYNELGIGFLESVYEKAMFYELQDMGLKAERQKQIIVYYEEREVGIFYADLLVENKIIVELKASEILANEHFAQLINYLKATRIEVGLLLNFGKKPEVRRKIFDNDFK